MTISEIVNSIHCANKICITNHTSQDGDALGSALGLYNILKKMDKNVYVRTKEKVPSYLNFLPGCKEISVSEDIISEDTDCVIVLDCGNVDRINAEINIDSRHYTLINIDHHISNDMYGDLNYVDTKASAVGEIIYDLIGILDIELSQDIAECLYVSILTDTGAFKYTNTSKKTHKIAGELVATGIKFTEIYEKIFDRKTFNKIKLFGRVIDTIELFANSRACTMEVRQKDVEELSLVGEDTGDVITFGTKIDSVEVTALLKEKDGLTKVSLRSKKEVDVRKIAELFGGGGHVRAAGFASDESIEQVKKELVNIISKELI